ncbi:hypothetical protein [Pseudoneobacillus rhizosphaerae]|uniref:Phosphoribosyltransferase n=1 Tax=Pseudoneobacillus rhizosphaerae TaxID=2880968 RepID=A0A9C7L9N3_9BACI|nr:hypothetical protein [Pseudoneobacillus rhizosphaerae]CAG9606585.1 hypothetical protein NEOCIP111885_00273 [Pseudoneobacillus rhizosphaerae]
MNYRSYSDLSNLIKNKIPMFQSKNFDLIVGVPRSGMIPAYIIALHLNKKCCDVETLINNYPLKTGSTRNAKNDIKYPSQAINILLVDDSICRGTSLANELSKIPAELKVKITTLAIYSSERERSDVNLYLEYLPMPRVFEWNIFHHNVLERSCFDIDGVLCIDPSEEQNDDGEKYIEFIKNAPSLFLPTGRINCLVTSRLEKYRPETENWLKKNGIKYNSLIMLDLPSKEERQRLGAHATHKAEAYKKLGLDLFYESERNQAIKIHELTKKPVYCVDTNEMFTKGSIYSAIYGSSGVRKSAIFNMIKTLPIPLYKSLRFFYRLIK